MSDHHTPEAAHSPIGASSCERWKNCPGSVKLAEKIPPQPSTIYAATGTVAHTLGEKTILAIQENISTAANLPLSAVVTNTLDDEVGRSYVQDDFEIEVDEKMIEAVEIYIKAIAETVDEYNASWLLDVRPEVRFYLPHIDKEAFGTCDAAIVIPYNRIIVFDYKHGQGYAVEVADNYQMLYYALGAYYELSETLRSELAYVEMVIVQPRAKHLDGNVRRHVISIGELLAFEGELTAAIAAVRSQSAALKAGRWCKFCPAKAICPEIVDRIQSDARVSFGNYTHEPVNLPEPSRLDPARLAAIIRNAEDIGAWVDAVLKLGKTMAVNGTQIPGFKLVKKLGRRRWINPDDVEAAFSLDLGDRMFTRTLKSPAQLEKVLKERKAELDPYIEIPVAGVSLVPADDDREAVDTSPASYFK